MTRDYVGAKAFYGNVFGYTFEKMEAGFTCSTLKRASDGEVVGGLGELDANTPAEVPASWVIYFLVEDCDASVAKASSLGAVAVREPFDTPFGRMASLTGPQGEAFPLITAPQPGDSTEA